MLLCNTFTPQIKEIPEDIRHVAGRYLNEVRLGNPKAAAHVAVDLQYWSL